jgi:TonB-linked SusC/RagA family outer membrane protein
MRKTALLLLLSTYGSLAFAQQSQKVRGKVLDADNKPVAGATVNIKGSASGTKTDADGSFTLDVAKGKTLKITYVGMKEQEVLVNDASTYSIILQSGTELDEVVVIGYGTVKKSDLTGAVASVTGKDLQSNLAKSAAGALQGRVAGVSVSNAGGSPGAGMNINIRGIGSMGSTNPLYVIDGVFGDINTVDPNDIASLEVLKDASAAAIYGSRAANGVVIITTKGGKRASPATLSLNAYTGVQSLPKKMSLMDGPQWKKFVDEKGYLPVQAKDFNANTDWQDEVFQTAPVNKINLDVAGGGDRSTYSVSGGYLNQKGILKTTGYESFNVRSKNTFNFFNDHLRVGNTFLIKSGDRQYANLVITDPASKSVITGL